MRRVRVSAVRAPVMERNMPPLVAVEPDGGGGVGAQGIGELSREVGRLAFPGQQN